MIDKRQDVKFDKKIMMERFVIQKSATKQSF